MLSGGITKGGSVHGVFGRPSLSLSCGRGLQTLILTNFTFIVLPSITFIDAVPIPRVTRHVFPVVVFIILASCSTLSLLMVGELGVEVSTFRMMILLPEVELLPVPRSRRLPLPVAPSLPAAPITAPSFTIHLFIRSVSGVHDCVVVNRDPQLTPGAVKPSGR